jgi:hypothetical protein
VVDPTAERASVGQPIDTVHGHEEAHMAGMFRKLIASGVAAKLVQEARKPQNQEKIKQLVAKIGEQNKKRGGGAGRGRGPGH